MAHSLIALLGRKDHPTDAVEDYCHYLADALQIHHFQLEPRRVPWDSLGWSEALKALRLLVQALPPGTWFLVQYTALAWSNRGFPHKFLRVLRTLRTLGARTAVIFHDIEPFSGYRLIDRLRRAIQRFTMYRATSLATCTIFTVPREKISWPPAHRFNAHFIPVGANLPIPEQRTDARVKDRIPNVAVFSITGGQAGAVESKAIIDAVLFAAQRLGRIRLSVFGRNADSAETVLREALRSSNVEVSVEGLLEDSQIVERLSDSDVLLFVRGPISSRRSSAIAGIACGLPVVAYSGSETAPPITEAGVVLVRPDNQEELNAALLRVLADDSYRALLAARSSAAFAQHFSWRSIAARFVEALNSRT